VVAFGTKLCSDLATFGSITGAFYGLLASLAAAVYFSKAVVWFCGGWALLYGTPPRLARISCVRNRNLSALQPMHSRSEFDVFD
jgi:hypothetical protein